MKYQIEISKIIQGGINLDRDKVLAYSQQLVDKLVSDGDVNTANRVKRIVESENNTLSVKDSVFKKLENTPVDMDSRFSMVDIVYPNDNTKEVVLSDEIELDINYFVENYKKSDQLSEAGLDIASKLLLYGPPGTGKTQTAYHIAQKLGLPLLVARLDSIVSSYLGTTAKNIRTLFEYSEQMPCVLFLDEFDAIAKKRDDLNELGELKRVVNSLLQNIDNMNSNSLLIAATNHENLLDAAVWRRFDYKINIGLPQVGEIQKLLSKLIPNTEENDDDIIVLSYMLDGKSGAEIERLVNQKRRESIINETDLSVKELISKMFANIMFEKYGDKEVETKRKITFLRNLDDRIFTYKTISEIIGVSKSTISQVLKGES
ncbi:AAA family ATPase [Enterococcus gallinarum]|uniref:AAA family ATPase n=1 Tax=Enterococcus gallinarum TaxID=1353 RepID=UPI003D6C1BDD